jgi:hypothetical protein
MTLAYDITRCAGGKHSPCPERETCARYIERENLGMRTPVMLQVCDKTENKIEVKA